MAAIGGMVGASSAGAAGPPSGSEFRIASFLTEVKNDAGADETRAGAHPFSARAEFSLSTYQSDASLGYPLGTLPVKDPKTIITKLPPGFSGDPMATPRCPLALVPRVAFQPMLCPDDTVVGYVYLNGTVRLSSPIVNVEPEHGYPAEFAFSEAGLTYTLYPELRSDGDYGLNLVVPAANNDAITQIDVTFCGYGAEFTYFAPVSGDSTFRCLDAGEPKAFTEPFLTNPATECPAEAPFTDLLMDSWQSPGDFVSARAVSPLITSCETLEFEPSVDIAPTTTLPDAPTGLNVDMTFPQEDNAQGQAPPALKKAVVTLPEGMTINPSGAGGLAACADGELLLKSKDPMTCPDASKVGTVVAKSPLMEEEINGSVYIRSQNSRDPESGEMFRLALVLQNKKRGIDVRLPGQIKVNKATGRIETIFDNNPELPVSSLKLKFKDGPRAPLATPPTCGPKTTSTVLTSWGKQTKTLESTFNISCVPGLGGFSPGFQAGTQNPTAGASSPFNLLLQRADTQDVIDGLRLEMPEGLLANLKGNVGTQVGTVQADAGPGSHPYRFPGKVYLEGPYADAPFSLRVVIPAKAGPFDLGEVVVRQKIYVDPTDAHVTVVSDPIPTIVEGVPVRLRNMQVNVDKPGFMINPTSCAQKQIGAVAHSLGGQSANLSTRFQVGSCDKLTLKPKLALTFKGSKETKFHKHPGLSATVTQVPGETGLKNVKVTLPGTIALDTKNAKALCKPEQARAKACPEGSIVGDATAISPVLNRPLRGHVYFVEGLRTTAAGKVIPTLPKLWVALRGEVALDVWADSDSVNQRLVNTFAKVPDAPISSFRLNIDGGKNGILQVSNKARDADLCKANQFADSQFSGHNGRVLRQVTRIGTPCSFKARSGALTNKAGRVTVSGLKAGKLTLKGKGVRTTSRKIAVSNVATISAKLTADGRRAYRSGRSLKLTAVFKPAGKGTKSKSTSIRVKRAKAKTRAVAPG